jgi:uncharacterized protein DUF4382
MTEGGMRSGFMRWISLAVLATVAACNGEHMGAGGGGTRILLTDAPFPFDQVERVDVHIVRIEGTSNPDTTTAQQWQTLVEPDRNFNLLDVQNGATALLGEARVAAGQFAAIRMVIRTDLSSITLAGGAAASVNWAGPATQFINALVEQPLSITTGGSGNLILDFDVGRSFVLLPGGGFQFLPWIRAVNEDATGSISGVVTGSNGQAPAAPVARASVAVYRSFGSSLTLAATGVTDAQGHYTIHYVSGGGPYVVEAAPPANYQAAPGYTNDVMVTPGQQSSADVTLSAGTGASDGELRISGPSQVLVGSAITLSAFVFNANGDSVAGAPVTWVISDQTVARLEGTGSSVRITGLTPGIVSIEARSNDLMDSVAVTVGDAGAPVASVQIVPDTATIPVGDTTGLRAVAKDAIGNVLEGRTITWTIDQSLLADIGHSGDILFVRALAPGTSIVTAIVEGKQGTARVKGQ